MQGNEVRKIGLAICFSEGDDPVRQAYFDRRDHGFFDYLLYFLAASTLLAMGFSVFLWLNS